MKLRHTARLGLGLLLAATAQSASAQTLSVVVPDRPDPLLDNLTVSNDAAQLGMWSSSQSWPIVSIHSALLPDGSVLTFGSPQGQGAQDGRTLVRWNPWTLQTTISPNSQGVNSFCAAGVLQPETGKILISGGNEPLASTMYDYASGVPATEASQLAAERWYATMTMLPDGRTLITGGAFPYAINVWQNPGSSQSLADVAMTPEVYTPGSGWSSLFGANSRDAFGPDHNRWWYPRQWVAPDGNVFGISSEKWWRLSTAGNGSIIALGDFKTGQNDSTRPNIGPTSTAVMYDIGKVLQVGGNGYSNEHLTVSSERATVFDINGGNPVITDVSPMQWRRQWVNSVVVPTGDVVVTGGTQFGDRGNPDAVYQAELWDPDTQTFSGLASAGIIRNYHSTTILLENGAIFSSGGGVPGPVTNFNYEIYYPPYLFQAAAGADVLAPRPRMVSIDAARLAHGSSFQVEMDSSETIERVAFIGLSTTTHSFNMGQRYYPAGFTQAGDFLTVDAPPNKNLAPPGYYLLYAVNDAGVPSPGFIVELGDIDCQVDADCDDGNACTINACAAGVCTSNNTCTDPLAVYLFDADGTDVTGNGNDASLINGASITGGGEVDINGGSQHVDLPDGLLQPCADFTFAAWVQLDVNADWNRIFDFGNDTATNMFLTPKVGGADTLRFAIKVPGNNGGAEEQLSFPMTFPLGAWVHVAVVLEGNTGRLFVDGTEVATGTIAGDPSDMGFTVNNWLGQSNWPDPQMDGRLDEVEISCRGYTAQEIAQLAGIGSVCGDSTCDLDEDCSSCPSDCGACQTCGDGTCEAGEDCSSCSQDCGACALPSALYLEAESAALSGNPTFSVVSDGTAAGGAYITPTSNNLSSAGPNRATFDFTVDAGNYVIWGRTRAGSFDDDSFWVSVDGGSFARWNDIPQSSTWSWDDAHNSDAGGAQLVFALSAGSHTLQIANREDGVLLDKLYITANGDVPSGEGDSCGDDLCGATEDCGSCELDCGSCPDVCGDGTCGPSEDCNLCAADCGACPETCGNGTCGAGEDCNSCAADCGACPETCGNGTCGAGEDCNSCAADCGVCPETCGNGTCGAGEDCNSCAADCGACPETCGNGTCGAGEDCNSCAADCGACSATTSVYLEAELAAFSGSPSFGVVADASAAGGAYIAPASNNTGSPGPNRALYTFTVDAGDYVLWGRTIAPTAADDSFWVSVDGGSFVRWNDIPQSSTWAWDDVHNSDAGGATMVYSLASGSHTIEIANREDGVRLDKLYFTADGDIPAGVGGDVCGDNSCGGTEDCNSCPGDCGNCPDGSVLINTTFASGADGFSYMDDTFRGTTQPAYASGVHSGGALQVSLGGVNATAITGMSGGWGRVFTLPIAGTVDVVLEYSMTAAQNYEDDECSQVLLSVDGMLLGGSGDTVAEVCSGGSAAGTFITSVDLAVGSHQIVLGGYNNKKTEQLEATTVVIDAVSVVAQAPVCSTSLDCDDADPCTSDSCAAGSCNNVDNGTCGPTDVATYPMNEGGGTAVADTTGQGNDGVLMNGASFTPSGFVGGAVEIDGGTQHVDLPDGLISDCDDFTFAAWVSLDANADWNRIFDFGNDTATNMFLTPKVGGADTLRFALKVPTINGGAEEQLSFPLTFPLGAWTHVAVVLDGDVGTLYVDGTAVVNGTITGNPSDMGVTINNWLGQSNWPDPQMDGRLDDVRISCRPYSASEISDLTLGSAESVLQRSLFETTEAAVSQFDLAETLDALGANAGFAENGVTLYQEMIDSFASAPGNLPTAVHCGDETTSGAPSLNGFPIECDRLEAQMFNNLSTWFATAVVNRIDLAPSDGAHCGNQRIVFASNAPVGNARNLLIVEAEVPNPNPTLGLNGCLPIAQFWDSLQAVSDPVVRGALLHDAFLVSGGTDFAPFIDANNLMVGTGQIRTNSFNDDTWTMREFKLEPNGPAVRTIPFPVEAAPAGVLWNDTVDTPVSQACRDNFLTAMQGLLTDNPAAMRFDVDEACRDAESVNDFTAQNYPMHLLAGDSNGFQADLATELSGTGLTPVDIAARARFAGSCIGCHQESKGSSLGNGVQAPSSLNFVHVEERFLDDCADGPCFPISNGLKDVFLPHRGQVMSDLLAAP